MGLNGFRVWFGGSDYKISCCFLCSLCIFIRTLQASFEWKRGKRMAGLWPKAADSLEILYNDDRIRGEQEKKKLGQLEMAC